MQEQSDKRCKNCGEPLRRKERESAAYFAERMFCNRQCYVIWGNAKLIWQSFAEKTREAANGCVEWVGHRDPKGYGRASSGFGEVLAHRISYIMHNGPIPEGLHVLHRCDNPSCCNPRHLFLGTNLDNVNDRLRKGRSVKLYGKENPNYRHGKNCKAAQDPPAVSE